MREEDDTSDVSKTSCTEAGEERKPGKGRCVMSRKMLLEQEKQRSEEREKLRGASKDRLMNRGPGRR